MNEFVNEVDEAMRRDEQVALAKRYGPWIAGVAILVIVLVGGLKGYQAWSQKAHESAAVQYQNALNTAEQGDIAGARSGFEALSTEGPAVYKAMAHIQLANLALAEEKPDDAIAALDNAIAASSDQILRDTSHLKAAYILADDQPEAALQRLAKIEGEDSPYRFSAQELRATLLMDSQPDEARQIFERLRLSLEAPESLRQRADVTLAMMAKPDPSSEPAEVSKDPAPSLTDEAAE